MQGLFTAVWDLDLESRGFLPEALESPEQASIFYKVLYELHPAIVLRPTKPHEYTGWYNISGGNGEQRQRDTRRVI